MVPAEDHKYSKRDIRIIESHAGWNKATHFGDPAGRFTNQVTNQSVMDVLKNYGIHVNFREQSKDFQTRKTETKILLRTLVMHENEQTKELGAAIENASYPKVRAGGGEEIKSIKPKHDWTSHYRSALEYFAVNFEHLRGRQVKVIDKFPVKPRNRIRVSGY